MKTNLKKLWIFSLCVLCLKSPDLWAGERARFALQSAPSQTVFGKSAGTRFQVLSITGTVLSLPQHGIALTIQNIGDALQVSWPNQNGRYELEWTSSLENGIWRTLQYETIADASVEAVSFPKSLLGETGFLRLIRR